MPVGPRVAAVEPSATAAGRGAVGQGVLLVFLLAVVGLGGLGGAVGVDAAAPVAAGIGLAPVAHLGVRIRSLEDFVTRGKLEVAGNEGHEQAGKADRAVVPLRYFPLPIGCMPSWLAQACTRQAQAVLDGSTCALYPTPEARRWRPRRLNLPLSGKTNV